MSDFTVERLPIADLIAHKRNARKHPEQQLLALEKRFRALGWYKNVVVARWRKRLTILAGHGIILGAQRAGETHAPCHVREIDPQSPEAIDILEGDNTSAEFAEDDLTQRLANLLTVQEAGRLENTGYDDGLLEALKGQLQAEEAARQAGQEQGSGEDNPFLGNNPIAGSGLVGLHIALTEAQYETVQKAFAQVLANREDAPALKGDRESMALTLLCEGCLAG